MNAPRAPIDAEYRASVREYSIRKANAGLRDGVQRLYGCFDTDNRQHFEGRLVDPLLFFTTPSNPRRYGDCGPYAMWGGQTMIRIRPSLLEGTHPHVCSGAAFAEGRFLLVADVLLHELIHQWQQEVSGQTETAYHGHGPAFRDMCNQIGQQLGLEPVRDMKKRGRDWHLPSCSYWPHNVRPAGYFLGAFVPANRDEEREKQVRPALRLTRPKAWNLALETVSAALTDLRSGFGTLKAALETLQEFQFEYEEWRDTLPENLQSSATAEKLEEVCSLDIEGAVESLDMVEAVIEEAAGVDLPRGFGRD